jgi:hypothetical protein
MRDIEKRRIPITSYDSVPLMQLTPRSEVCGEPFEQLKLEEIRKRK